MFGQNATLSFNQLHFTSHISDTTPTIASHAEVLFGRAEFLPQERLVER